MYTYYSVNSTTGAYENFQYRFETNTSSQWVWDSPQEGMYAAVHPNDNNVKGGINNLSNAAGITISFFQEVAKANPGSFIITTATGTQIIMTTDQLIVGLEVASRNTLVLGTVIEAGLALSGFEDAQNNLVNDTAVSLSLAFISAAGCGVPALILGVGWVMYRNGAFDGILNNTNPPQNTTRPQYPSKDGPQPIFFNH